MMRLKASLVLFLLNLIIQISFAGEENHVVIIKKFAFNPQEITIKRGETIRWENKEKRQYHSVWFEALGEEEPDDYFYPDEFYEREFNETGSFSYRCGPHPRMKGLVIVTE